MVSKIFGCLSKSKRSNGFFCLHFYDSCQLCPGDGTRCVYRWVLLRSEFFHPVYTYNFHPGFSLTLVLPPSHRSLFSLVLAYYSISLRSGASPREFPVRGGGLRRGPPLTVLRKLVEITIIIRSNRSAMLRRVTPRLLASLPTSSECYLSSSSSSSSFFMIRLATCFRDAKKLAAKQSEDAASLNLGSVEKLDSFKTFHIGISISIFLWKTLMISTNVLLLTMSLSKLRKLRFFA